MANLKDPDRRLLWGRSGAMCAYSGCGARLIEPIEGKTRPNGDPVEMAVAEEAHIVAEKEDGPRGDATMPVSERNSYPNMILLCYKHHKFVDRDNGEHFTVAELHAMKDEHERMVHERVFAEPSSGGAAVHRDLVLAEALVASRARLIARWAAAGLDDERACELADDPAVGAGPKALPALPEAGLVVLAGEFGSGKSVTAERLHQADIAFAQAEASAPVPLFVTARSLEGSLIDAVVAAAAALGAPGGAPVRLVLDGLDEAGTGRAGELVDEARVIVNRRPGSRVLATARPGVSLRPGEAFAYPEMDLEEAETLALRIGGRPASSHAASAAVRAALRFPLFMIIATLARNDAHDVPHSRADFLDLLVTRALNRPGVAVEDAHESLARLARLTTEAGGPVPAAEFGDELHVRTAVATRLVTRRGRALEFSLPVLEQYFAARSLLAEPLSDEVLSSPTELDRWRYPLALALAGCSWQQSVSLLAPILARVPGLASWVIQEAVPEHGRGSAAALPSAAECGRRVGHALDAWLDALAPLSALLAFRSDEGGPTPVNAAVNGPSLTTTVSPPPISGADASELRRQPPLRSGHPPADYPAWPWSWSLEWIKVGLSSLLQGQRLDAGARGPAATERRWELCRAMTNQHSSLVPAIDSVSVLEVARRHLAEPNLVRSTFQAGRAVHADAAELRRLVGDFEAGIGLDTNGMIQWPYPAPVPPPVVKWGLDLYDDQGLTDLVTGIYRNALAIYGTLVDRWIPNLRPTLGLACILPVAVTGTVTRGQIDQTHPADFPGHSVAVLMSLLPPGNSSSAAFDYAPGQLPDPGFDTVRRLRAEGAERASAWHPGSEPWANPRFHASALSVPSEKPATDLAYTWLWQDLAALRLASLPAPRE